MWQTFPLISALGLRSLSKACSDWVDDSYARRVTPLQHQELQPTGAAVQALLACLLSVSCSRRSTFTVWWTTVCTRPNRSKIIVFPVSEIFD